MLQHNAVIIEPTNCIVYCIVYTSDIQKSKSTYSFYNYCIDIRLLAPIKITKDISLPGVERFFRFFLSEQEVTTGLLHNKCVSHLNKHAQLGT